MLLLLCFRMNINVYASEVTTLWDAFNVICYKLIFDLSNVPYRFAKCIRSLYLCLFCRYWLDCFLLARWDVENNHFFNNHSINAASLTDWQPEYYWALCTVSEYSIVLMTRNGKFSKWKHIIISWYKRWQMNAHTTTTTTKRWTRQKRCRKTTAPDDERRYCGRNGKLDKWNDRKKLR